MIDDTIAENLNNIHFTMKPRYNARVKDGKTKVSVSGISVKVTSVEIGRLTTEKGNALLGLIVHEELEARIAVRADRHWGGKFGEMLEKTQKRHKYIDAVIARYFRLRGWNHWIGKM
jgi:hypothetical protein